MRILFTSVGAKAHAFVQTPVAWALRSAGHEVRVAAPPDLTDDITRSGLTAVPVGALLDRETKMAAFMEREERAGRRERMLTWGSWTKELRIGEVRPERLTHDHMRDTLIGWTSLLFQYYSPVSMVDDLVDFARDWRPDLVVWDTVTFGGAVAARASGAAHARLLVGLDLVGALRQRYRPALEGLPPELREDPLEEWLGWTLDRFGCGPFDEEMVVGQWTIDPMPASMRLPVDLQYVPVRHVPYNGPATVPGWLREPPKRPRVCLTLGVSLREIVGEDQVSVGDLLEAVAELDVEVVATLNDDQLADVRHVPGNVRTAGFVPLNELLPTCSAIIHHGGFGTLQSALVHGVPQIVIPTDLWDNIPKADKLHESGAGLARAPEGLTAAAVRDMLVRVLEEPSFAANAARLRTELLGRPTPADIVPLLERLTEENRPR
ncbi:activator-dependent family glycosyltransferase [Actinomadura viridis]|uniref:activator-dependent family glycosyltransferase n=1 Tax=Actinomadura viridis TaxID=58110 RepID=UPI00369B6218